MSHLTFIYICIVHDTNEGNRGCDLMRNNLLISVVKNKFYLLFAALVYTLWKSRTILRFEHLRFKWIVVRVKAIKKSNPKQKLQILTIKHSFYSR